MGVINITPDSFSDGGQFNDPDRFKTRLEQMLLFHDMIDIGAESTAPFNKRVDSLTEKKRFDHICDLLVSSYIPKGYTFSIDTYKAEVFDYMKRKLLLKRPDLKLIWNDVTGLIDDSVKGHSTLKGSAYILGHSLLEDREQPQSHMNFLTNDIIQSLINQMQSALKLLGDQAELWFDPCFGFSKTRQDNYEILKKLHELELPGRFKGWVIGASRKSFLRNPKELDVASNNELLEQCHALFINEVLNKLESPIIFRIHDYRPLYSALAFREYARA